MHDETLEKMKESLAELKRMFRPEQHGDNGMIGELHEKIRRIEEKIKEHTGDCHEEN